MPSRIKLNLYISLALVGLIFISGGFLSGGERRQKPQTNAPQNPAPQTSDDSTLRISTVLVQTDVTVVDRDGQFIDGLRPDQFELKVDGKPQRPPHFRSGFD